MRLTMTVLASALVAACGSTVPDSGYRGVGFNDYDDHERARAAREAELTGSALPSPSAVSSEPLSAIDPAIGSGDEAESVAAATREALARTGGSADASETEGEETGQFPQTVANDDGISIENDFEAVDARRSIEADAALIEQNRAQYKVIEPTELPTRTSSHTPNIVEFALRTSHPPGTQMYRRSPLNSEARHLRNCAQYASADQAQLDFLSRGGPERDRLGLDPEGDGYACGWDPRPFRAAVAAGGGA